MDAKRIENETRHKYDGGIYNAGTICAAIPKTPRTFSERLLALKFELVNKYLTEEPVLDLCCGSGLHLMDIAKSIRYGVGLDFSASFIAAANAKKKELGLRHIEFFTGDAHSLPFESGAFGCVYSFSSLYHIPEANQVINEISRVTAKSGIAIFELGNLYSLNTIVCRAYPELAHPCHIPTKDMLKYINAAGLRIVEHRCFQTLPLWANRPWWLLPLLHPLWTRIMAWQVRGKMLDEWMSSSPVFRFFAFRHIFVCARD